MEHGSTSALRDLNEGASGIPGTALSRSPVIGIRLSVEERRARITRRLIKRLDAGLVDEVRGVLNQGVSSEQLLFYGLEYKFDAINFPGELDEKQFFTRLTSAFTKFAKRDWTSCV